MNKDELACSFCLRTAAEVDRLISGPACYICDACVGECTSILSDPTLAFPTMDASADDEILGRLRPAAARVAIADEGLRGLVDLLRSRRVSWARIGESLGVSRQAAWERFG